MVTKVNDHIWIVISNSLPDPLKVIRRNSRLDLEIWKDEMSAWLAHAATHARCW